MATETGGEEKRYLHRVLAGGARSFRYRSRIRKLLGLPESSGVGVIFSKPLPFGGFAYVVPRFSGEFEFPDELLAGGPRRGDRVEEIEIGPQSHGTADTRIEPGRPTTEAEKHVPARPEVRPIPQIPQIGDPVPKHQMEEQGEAKTASQPARQARGPQHTQTPRAHELIVPGVSRTAGRVENLEAPTRQAIPPAPQRLALKADHSIPQAPDSPATNVRLPVAAEPVHPQQKASGPAFSPREGSEGMGGIIGKPLHSVTGSTTQTEVLVEPHATRPPSRQPLSKPSAVMPPGTAFLKPTVEASRETSRAPKAALQATGRSLPALRRRDAPSPGKARAPFENHNQFPSDASSGQTPAASPAPPPIVVVQPVPDAGMTLMAFWERRHLSYLKVRIRR